MSDCVRITDVSPRDGLQNEPGVVPTADKVRLIELLAAAGVDEIEATSFVSPKWVPQLGDAEAVLTALRERASTIWQSEETRSNQSNKAPAEPSPHGRGQGEGTFGTPHARADDDRSEFMRDRARGHRRRQTIPEKILWSKLRNRRLLGLKFRRQAPIGPYIVDFLCDALRLVIEIDGRTHYGEEAYARDVHREMFLREKGLNVVRYTNDQVLRDMDVVLTDLKSRVEGRCASGGREKKKVSGPLTPTLSRRERESELASLAVRHRVLSHPFPTVSVLVPNREGFERARRFHSDWFPLKIAVFTAASEAFNKKNTNASIAESIERFRLFVPEAIERRMAVRMYVSCAVACPYEGKIEPASVRRVCDELLDLVPPRAVASGLAELDLGDTIGVATTGDIERLLDKFTVEERSRLTLHLHDTSGRAAECVKTALEMGVRSFDGSAAGLGGCPYAGAKGKRAPGNISTESLVSVIHEAGYTTNINRDLLNKAAMFAHKIVSNCRSSSV